MIELGVFARAYPPNPLDVVAARAAADGFRHLHVSPPLVGLGPDGRGLDPDAVGATLERTGCRIASVSGTFNAIHPDVERRRRETLATAALLPDLPDVGADLLTLCTGTRDPDDPWRRHPDNDSAAAWSDLRDTLDVLVPAAEAAGVRLGVEPEAGNVVRDAACARRLLDEVGSPALVVVFDAANLLRPTTLPRQRAVLDAALDLVGERVVVAHAKDLTAVGPAEPGRGAIDWEWVIERLGVVTDPDPLPLVVQDVAPRRLRTVAEHLTRCGAHPTAWRPAPRTGGP